MIYLVTEDENSGREFWIKVLQTFQLDGTYKIMDLLVNCEGKAYGGSGALRDQIDKTLEDVCTGDTIVIILDVANDRIIQLLRNIKYECDIRKVSLMYTNYFCFEELYLSYLELSKLYSVQNNVDKMLLSTLDYVRECILKEENYFNVADERIKYIIDTSSGAGKNREHFANVLLSVVTSKIKGHFRITKKKNGFGECWLDSCSDIIESGSTAIYNCNTCKYCCKGCTTKEKLLDLRRRSLLALSDK